MTPGETRTISQTVYPSAGYGLATFGYADNHNNIVITSTTQKDNYFTINASVTMPLNASGDQSGTITYQWQKRTASGTRFADVSGATSASLVLSGQLAANDGDSYRVKLNSSKGAKEVVSSIATLSFGS